jgi:hypothetical protein
MIDLYGIWQEEIGKTNPKLYVQTVVLSHINVEKL